MPLLSPSAARIFLTSFCFAVNSRLSEKYSTFRLYFGGHKDELECSFKFANAGHSRRRLTILLDHSFITSPLLFTTLVGDSA